MKKMKFNTLAARSVTAGLFLGAVMAAQGALACTIENWSGKSEAPDAELLASGPDGPNDKKPIARYSGLCAMQADGQGIVQDESPGGINRIIARFYVLVDPTVFSGSAEVYAGFSSDDGSGKLFSVAVDDTGNVTLTDTATGASISKQGSTNWLSVEIDWIQDGGSGELNLIVNGAAATPETGLNNAGSGTALRSVQLGNLDGGGSGPLNFDAYESRRTTAVGRLVHPDPNGDGNPNGIDALDFSAMVNDFLEIQRASGAVDCNEDGNVAVDSLDFACIVTAFINQ